jgi:hypothetical protein
LALGSQIEHPSLARPGEIAHCLVLAIRNPHRSQIAAAEQLRQAHRVTPVRLHPIARLLRNERGRGHDAAKVGATAIAAILIVAGALSAGIPVTID